MIIFQQEPIEFMHPTKILWLLTFTLLRRWNISGNEIRTNLPGDEYQHTQMPEELKTSQKDNFSLKTNSKVNVRLLRSADERKLSTKRKSVEVASLSALLRTIVLQELNDCRLLLVYDASDLYSIVVQDLLLLLPNPRQVRVSCSQSL